MLRLRTQLVFVQKLCTEALKTGNYTTVLVKETPDGLEARTRCTIR